MKSDFHLHTAFSEDSEFPMEESVKTAIGRGLDIIGYSDHIDYGLPRTECICDAPAYAAELSRLREKYSDRIDIKMGMEFGMMPETVDDFQKVYNSLPFDFIILSCHQVDGLEMWNQQYQKKHSQKEYNEGYYNCILKTIRTYRDYSFLGHLDVITRYDEAEIYPFERVRDIIAEILKTAIADGKGIEVNTSCYRYGLKDLTPSRDILALYKDLGGEIITIGSDAHRAEDIGYKIVETQKELKAMGFDTLFTFDRMRPIAHNMAEF